MRRREELMNECLEQSAGDVHAAYVAMDQKIRELTVPIESGEYLAHLQAKDHLGQLVIEQALLDHGYFQDPDSGEWRRSILSREAQAYYERQRAFEGVLPDSL